MPQMTRRRRIAFLLLAHNDPEMAVRLCRRLAPHRVFAHVDDKARDFPTDQLEALEHVTVIARREAVSWGSLSVVKAILHLIRAALDEDEDFVRLMVISGTCYPVRPVAALAAHFADRPDHQDIALTEVGPDSVLAGLTGRHWAIAPFVSWQTLARHPVIARIESFARKWRNRAAKLIGRDIEREIGRRIYFGSTWWAMTPEACRFVLDSTDAEPRLLRAFSSVWSPDEQYVHTIIGNSHYRTNAVPVADRGASTLYEAPLHLICPGENRNFGSGEKNFVLIRESGKFFARKLSQARNAALLDRIDRELLSLGEPAPRVVADPD